MASTRQRNEYGLYEIMVIRRSAGIAIGAVCGQISMEEEGWRGCGGIREGK